MSIIIQNMGGDMGGVCEYELRINRDVIAKFKHARRDGLDVCLLEAAGAAKMARMRKAMEALAESYRLEVTK